MNKTGVISQHINTSVDEKAIIIDAFVNGKEITEYQMYDVSLCEKTITVVSIGEKNNIELIKGERCKCKSIGHLVQKHIISLKNNKYGYKRVGLGYVCKTCMKMYLNLEYCEGFLPSEYSGYTFVPWPENRDVFFKQEAKYRRDWFRDLYDSVPCFDYEALKYCEAKMIPAIQVREGTNIQIAGLDEHTCDNELLRCALILKDADNKREKFSMGNWCPRCNKYYSDSNDYVLSKTKKYDGIYTFKKHNEAKYLNAKQFPVKNFDDVEVPSGRKIYIGKDDVHSDKKHNIFPCHVKLLNTKTGKHVSFNNGSYCYDCDRYYIAFRPNVDSLKKHYDAYVYKPADTFSSEYKEYRRKHGMKEHDPDLFDEERMIEGHDFLVRRASFMCRKNGHKIKEITACITVIRKHGEIQEVFVPAWYCKGCGCYYISEGDYEEIKKHGIIVAQIYTETEWIERKNGLGLNRYLSSESILHKLGYNVGAADNLLASVRQDIIAASIDFGILTKRQILDFLDKMIELRRDDLRMENAVRKWKMDREFASSYALNTREYSRIKSITIRKKLY